VPRKRRLEFEDAVYHVISRGNYRKDLFTQRGAGERFEETLLETVDRCGWKVYAYVIMSNHYHLAVRTPEPNLVAGMQWLQSTFATRFNRYRNERGHVFQGRYKAILIGADRPLLGLIDYIHLNPVRAGICEVAGLRRFRLSSYPKYWRKRVRDGLERKGVLGLCDQPDSVEGMRRYALRLEASEAADPAARDRLWKAFCRGWFIGPEDQKRELAKELAQAHPDVDWELTDYAELKEARWEWMVEEELKRRGKSEEDVGKDAKGAHYKAEIAWRLRRETTAGNPWIAKRLNMGHPSRVSNLIREIRNV